MCGTFKEANDIVNKEAKFIKPVLKLWLFFIFLSRVVLIIVIFYELLIGIIGLILFLSQVIVSVFTVHKQKGITKIISLYFLIAITPVTIIYLTFLVDNGFDTEVSYFMMYFVVINSISFIFDIYDVYRYYIKNNKTTFEQAYAIKQNS